MKPIETLSLFPDLNQELIYFLADLKAHEWLLPTALPGRNVKDLAAHLVDGSMRRIAAQRDHFKIETDRDLSNYDQLVEHVQELNREWMLAMRRLSPRLLVEMIKKYDKDVVEIFSDLKPEDEAMWPVAWAFVPFTPNWFDIAREYTERWHHQMQMRMATSRPLLLSERFLRPVYETFLIALPGHLNRCCFPDDKEHLLELEITGELNLRKRVRYNNQQWESFDNLLIPAQTHVKIPAQLGWILFTNTDRYLDKYLQDIYLSGNSAIAHALLTLKTVLS